MQQTSQNLAKRLADPAERARQVNKAKRLCNEGQIKPARRIFEAVLAVEPEDPENWHNLARLELNAHEALRTIQLVSKAIELDDNRDDLYCTAGAAFLELQMYEKAVRAYQAAAALNPTVATTFCNLSVALRNLGRWDEATAAALQAIQLDPKEAAAYDSLGVILVSQGNMAQATTVMEHALAIAPDYFSAWNNYGHLLLLQNRTAEAAVALKRALELHPDHPEIHNNLGMTLLKLGEFQEGWPEYEWRWKSTNMGAAKRPFAMPQWRGEAQPRTILLHAEQGLGDTLQFCRYAPLVAARGHKVVLEVQPEVLSLIGRSLASSDVTVVPRAPDFPGISGLPAADAHCPLLSVPGAMGTMLETIPFTPYLAAEPAKVAAWRDRFAAALPPGLRVGLVWAGNPRKEAHIWLQVTDARRSMQLSDMAPLFGVPGVAFVSLQKGAGLAQLAGSGLPLHNADDGLRDFSDTAAAVANLDLVVCVDTSIAHLVGGMGKPVWTLSRLDGCWRWLTDRDDTPWYPTMRLFRQGADRSWPKVIDQVTAALRDLAGTSRPVAAA